MKARAYAVALLSFCCGLTFANPLVTDATTIGNLATLSGENFGAQCIDCEVVADYGGFKYSLPIASWQHDRITVQLQDIGKGNHASLIVHGDTGTSNAVGLTLPEILVPQQKLHRLATPEDFADLQVFERAYDLSIGGKGVDTFDVSQPQAQCGATATVFDSAEIVLGRQTRFGDARQVESPARGCTACSPVKVRYYFEPTGKLVYQLHVYRREVTGICAEQIRN